MNEVLIRRHDSTQKLFNIFHDDKKKEPTNLLWKVLCTGTRIEEKNGRLDQFEDIFFFCDANFCSKKKIKCEFFIGV